MVNVCVIWPVIFGILNVYCAKHLRYNIKYSQNYKIWRKLYHFTLWWCVSLRILLLDCIYTLYLNTHRLYILNGCYAYWPLLLVYFNFILTDYVCVPHWCDYDEGPKIRTWELFCLNSSSTKKLIDRHQQRIGCLVIIHNQKYNDWH